MTSKAQLKAVQKYDDSHKKEKNYRAKRSSARNFVRKYGTYEDVKELQNIINERLQEEKIMIANIEFTAENKAYQTTIQFEKLNDNNTDYIGNRYVAITAVDIFAGNDIEKDMTSNLECYYTDEDFSDKEHIKAWFLDQIGHEYQEPEITEINIEEG
jgi:hypothetical protein